MRRGRQTGKKWKTRSQQRQQADERQGRVDDGTEAVRKRKYRTGGRVNRQERT